jgi:hypothetical protein
MIFLRHPSFFRNPLALFSLDRHKISFLIFPTAYDRDRWEQGHDANGKVPRLLIVTTYKNIFEHYAQTEEQDTNTTAT